MEGSKVKTAWILADSEKVGSQNQCIGLAENLGYQYTVKKIKLSFFYKITAPFFFFGSRFFASTDLSPPYPDLIIASGRQAASVVASLYGKVKTVFILDPYLPSFFFDAVIVPNHDARIGRSRRAKNVIKIIGSLHGLTKEKIEKAAAEMPFDVKKPVVTVLLGGDSSHFSYTEKHIKHFAAKLKKLSEFLGAASFLITPSRRTRPDVIAILGQELKGLECFFWNFEGDNPYHSFLGHADIIVATSDSISMTSEACGIGVPVLIEDLNIQHRKFKRFFSILFNEGHAYRFEEGNFPKLKQKPKILNEFEKVKDFLKKRNIID